ncbi:MULTISPECIES: bifunctional glutamate N-acetyltransferase/amino-acid acetyltransferase ArgJ [unclassified Synechococcus]|uniref:bifunctional glutamate N-acetyltransferase/amino-acid acetyltransferase ArgJ n=1 Tax=unclassified Synechococcus TaxID=2626047 RepID=UPI0000699AB0|nr:MULTISPECIES: bifunctional glutamate N-acetyltransferase/amino-acid acetyltransferase ArgJ [unclassified Synechococcus]EAQ76592.1 bifunctional ornithine acetyltransferase/N-acetylglutamate synthase protein [Synechococcus sp. WH 5701]WFN59228.1 bifunctional glutamate N-acetyltransferase/amino-acid acetyltransferase ArgJ [Synechococcus sp. CCFWC 502]
MTHPWHPIPGGITAPAGFLAAAITAGLKASGNPDLSLLLAPHDAVCAGSFTTSLVRAACVDLCAQRLAASGGRARAVLTNSGQANACTGDRGLIDSLRATQATADLLGLAAEEVLICSTGVIGVPIPMDILLAGLDPLVAALSPEGGAAAATAILTTDLTDKQIALEAHLGGRRVRLGGMAKGSGMIHPNMATMLGYLSCDAGVPAELWQAMVQRAVDRSFNAITVDGDTSTNDTYLAFAAGEPLNPEHFEALEAGLTAVSQHLARAIARDGEGATCLIEVQVEGAGDDAGARAMARTICGSSLVKCAIHGRDPNWGRIVAAAGRAGVAFDPEAVALWLGEHQLMAAGQPLPFDRPAASRYMAERAAGAYLSDDTVAIRLRVGDGTGSGLAWGCDLSDQYVRINADYTT